MTPKPESSLGVPSPAPRATPSLPSPPPSLFQTFMGRLRKSLSKEPPGYLSPPSPHLPGHRPTGGSPLAWGPLAGEGGQGRAGPTLSGSSPGAHNQPRRKAVEVARSPGASPGPRLGGHRSPLSKRCPPKGVAPRDRGVSVGGRFPFTRPCGRQEPRQTPRTARAPRRRPGRPAGRPFGSLGPSPGPAAAPRPSGPGPPFQPKRAAFFVSTAAASR